MKRRRRRKRPGAERGGQSGQNWPRYSSRQIDSDKLAQERLAQTEPAVDCLSASPNDVIGPSELVAVEPAGCKRARQLSKLICLQLLHLIAVLALVDFRGCTTATNIVNNDGDPNSVIIKTHHGQLFRGLRLAPSDSDELRRGDVVAFLGVRYASAPVKRLRFMPPTPFSYSKHTPPLNSNTAINQSQVHDMRQFGPICMQRFPMEPTREQAWPDGDGLGLAGGDTPSGPASTADWRTHRARLQLGLMERLLTPSLFHSWRPVVRKLTSRFVQSEDCLNLNIYTPIEALKREPDLDTANLVNATPNTNTGQQAPTNDQHRNRPVLVVIHGHSFEFGSGSVLDGRDFAQNNRAVVITLNYRLHILGFPPRLAGATRANLGLLDQVAALHWIQANVRSFGGSPTKITLMGSRGGAIFVHLLMLSPLAKGLFQRAILEDGTALSPVIANNMALGGSAGTFTSGQQRQQVVGASQQHSRLLAQLSDCPLARQPPQPAPSTSISNMQQQQQTLGQDEERTSLALMIECFKAKPAETIMRHLPAELIDTSRPVGSASVPLASRWLRPLEQTLDLLIKEELKSRLDDSNSNQTVEEQPSLASSNSRRNQLGELKRVLATASADQSAAVIESRQLNRLIGLMIDRFLQLPSLPATDEDGKLMVLLSELLGAIYLPSNKTLPVGPVFAPQLEPGLIALADSNQHTQLDLASSMLQRDSPFGRRDLLIGLTHPLVEFNNNNDENGPAPEAGSVQHQSAPLGSGRDGPAEAQLAPSLSSRKMLELGLTEEQAISQVNQFVRSFYRYHQQEISNSIISQYLSKKSNLRSTTGQQQVGGARWLANNRFEEQAGATDSEQQQLADNVARLHKQQFLAEAMQALHQDSLIDIPLIKTGLIHALHQLESLADLFVSEQLNKLEVKYQQQEEHDDETEQLIDERRLEEEFHKFARGFYENLTIWPIRLMPSSRVQDSTSRNLFEQKQPHSTFMFQIVNNKLDWLQTFVATLRRFEAEARHSEQAGRDAIRRLLIELIEEIGGKNGSTRKARLGLGCSFTDVIDGDRDDEMDERSSSLERFKWWICRRRIGRKLANFVETGNVNLGQNLQEASHINSRRTLMQQFAVNCNSDFQQESALQRQQDSSQALPLDDHHLVQLTRSSSNRSNFEIVVEAEQSSRRSSENSNGRKLFAGVCRRRLEELAFEEILNETTGDELDDDTRNRWPVFNVFTQQLASLFPTRDKPDWSVDSFVSSANANGQLREAFDGKVAFWANFVTALNCSKTQAIGASSLSLFSQANSTLLNMNLNLNCQQTGTRTANSVLHSLSVRIKHDLGQQVSIWRRLRSRNSNQRGQSTIANLSSSQNHHSLRMANMSNNQDQQQQQQQQTGQLESGITELVHSSDSTGSAGSSFASWLTVDAPNGTRKWFNQQQPPAVFWLLSGSILALMSVLAMGGFVVLRRHWRKRERNQKKQAEQMQTTSIDLEEITDWNSAPNMNISGTLLEQEDGGCKLASGADQTTAQVGADLTTSQQTKSISFVDCPDSNNNCNQQQQLNGFEHQQPSSSGNVSGCCSRNQYYYHEQDTALGVELVASQPGQHAYLIQQEADYSPDQNGRLEQATSGANQNVAPDGHSHLPTCNLMLHHIQHQQQQQQLLSSTSSETTTTQQAHSSVSLVSGSNSNAKRPTNKKRVKISDPKRHNNNAASLATTYQIELEPLELNAHQLELIGGSPQNFCPIHRSSSNMNLIQSDGQFIVDDTTKFQLLSGHHSLMRHHNHKQQTNGQQRALALVPNWHQDNAATGFAADNPDQQQVCAAHGYEQRHRRAQQQQQVIFANGFYQQQDAVNSAQATTIASRERPARFKR